MSTIRIFSKKTFAIGPGAQKGNPQVEYFLTVPLSFQDMPEKYTDDPTFKAAVKAGEITVVNNPTMVSGISPNPVNVELPKVEELAEEEEESKETSTIDEYYETLRKMNAAEVKAEAEKYNAEFVEDEPLKQNKKRVLEAYKLMLE